MIGGVGSDRMVGGSGDDLMIAGRTAHDNNDDALLAILSEWNSTRTYAERVANISGTGQASRLNGPYFLKKGDQATVFEDSDVDTLTGAAGSDWFFVDLLLDRVTDMKRVEQQT
jgi:hemolysin type calcium-binding protein